MKFLQLHTFYDHYLTEFYTRNPHLISAIYEDQISSIVSDGYGAVHIFPRYMQKIGYESQFIIANCKQAQIQWAKENNISYKDSPTSIYEISQKQIDIFKPDILYLSDPITLDSRFIKGLSWKPSLIMGWRGATVPETTDWTMFDIILSHLSLCRNSALEHGAKSVDHFFPGFPTSLSIPFKSKQWDVVFSGSWMPLHSTRNSYLLGLAQHPIFTSGKCNLGLFIETFQSAQLPSEIAMFNHGARWGLEMYSALKSGRIVINAEANHGKGEAGNMRLFEATGVGAFLLTEYQDNIEDYFEPGVEVETFKTVQELIDKIQYYLAHKDEREAIAKRGQQRCFQAYSMQKRAIEFDRIIKKHLTPEKIIATQTDTESFILQAIDGLNHGNPNEALHLIDKAIYEKPGMHGLNYCRAIALARLGRRDDAQRALGELLTNMPLHKKAQQLLYEINRT